LHERFLVVETEWGWCALARTEGGLSRSTLPLPSREETVVLLPANACQDERDELLRAAGALLVRYFRGERPDLDLPLDLDGRAIFSQRVLRACAAVPYGQTCTYGELAKRAGRPGAARAAGQVMARNPLPLFVPCHRIIGADGRLVGFGAGLEMKRRLLAHEGVMTA